ncbi:MAG: wax ester/triacylglycerol synthase family O-acyltransferase [Deltaproteobacteria bacterium]
MASEYYERLSGQDTMFLVMEEATIHMHVSAVQIFDAEPLRNQHGGVDFDKYRRSIEACLHLIPRYRQKLKTTPLEGSVVWVDDPNFNIHYHVRHTSLPRPGTERQLKHMAARIMGTQLDRAKPLWEAWLVEGLEGNRFAVITKLHHCMIDGASGVDLSHILMTTTPEYEVQDPPLYVPRPAPSNATLLRDQVVRRFGLPRRMLAGLARFSNERGRDDITEELKVRGKALLNLVEVTMDGIDETPINASELGPHRRFDWIQMPLDDVKAVRRQAGCTLNDVILTTVAGAVRRHLLRHKTDPGQTRFRVAAPVSVRKEEERGVLGNKVSSWIVDLPIGLEDPLDRLAIIHEKTKELKASRSALGIQMMMKVADWTPTSLLSLAARSAGGQVNMIVINVPGPQFPLYTLGSKMLSMYGQVPLLEGIGLGVALFSYDGTLFWGFNGEYDTLADLHLFCLDIEESFAELRDAVAGRRDQEIADTTVDTPSPMRPASAS